MNHVELDRIARCTLAVHHQLLVEVVTIVIVLAGVNVPRAKIITINTVVISFADKCCQVVLGDERAIRSLPGLILDVCGIQNVGEIGQSLVDRIRSAVGERIVVQAEERPELTQHGQIVVDKVLVGTCEIRVDNPMEVSFLRGEFNIQVIFSLPMNVRRGPIEI